MKRIWIDEVSEWSEGQTAMIQAALKAMKDDPGGKCFMLSPRRSGKSLFTEEMYDLYLESAKKHGGRP